MLFLGLYPIRDESRTGREDFYRFSSVTDTEELVRGTSVMSCKKLAECLLAMCSDW